MEYMIYQSDPLALANTGRYPVSLNTIFINIFNVFIPIFNVYYIFSKICDYTCNSEIPKVVYSSHFYKNKNMIERSP